MASQKPRKPKVTQKRSVNLELTEPLKAFELTLNRHTLALAELASLFQRHWKERRGVNTGVMWKFLTGAVVFDVEAHGTLSLFAVALSAAFPSQGAWRRDQEQQVEFAV